MHMLNRLINSIFGKRSVSENRPFSNRVNTYAGELVTPATAMQLNAVNACVRVIAEDIGSLPFFVYQRTDKGRIKADTHKVYRLLHDWPNDDMTPLTFKETITQIALLYGNGFAYINKDKGVAFEMLPLHPSKVRVSRDKSGQVLYQTNISGQWVNVPTDRIFHLKGLSDDGLLGKSPIEQAANSLGVALAVDKFAAKFFGQGALLSGYLTTAGKLDDGVRAEIKNSFAEITSGTDNAHGVPVLPLGMTYTPLGIPPEHCQFLQTKQYSVIDICRIYRISPTKIGDLTKSNFNTLEATGTDHVRSTLRPWLLRWEQEANRKLFLEAERSKYYAELEPAALMRGDTSQQNADYALGIQWGWYNRNEVRRMKNLPEIDGGDIYNMPLNMAPLAEVPAEAKPEEQQPADQQSNDVALDAEPQAEANDAATNADRFSPLVFDAAARIANKIDKALEREHGKGNADLSIWLDEYLRSKSTLFVETVKPLSMTMNPADGFLRADDFGEQLRTNLAKQLSDALAFEALPEFRRSLSKYIVQTFQECHAA